MKKETIDAKWLEKVVYKFHHPDKRVSSISRRGKRQNQRIGWAITKSLGKLR